MKPSGHLNPSEETGTGCPITSKYGSDGASNINNIEIGIVVCVEVVFEVIIYLYDNSLFPK